MRVKHGRLDQPLPVNDNGGTLRVELNHADPGVLPPVQFAEFAQL